MISNKLAQLHLKQFKIVYQYWYFTFHRVM